MQQVQQEALWMLGYLYLQHQRMGEALVVFRALAKLLPDNPRVQHSLAYAQLRTEQPRAALATLDALPLNPEPPAVALLRSQILWQLGRGDQARHYLHQFLDARSEV